MKIQLKNPTEFKMLLLEKGYSQRSFAQSIEIAPPYFNLIVNEERYPSGKVAKKIADELSLGFNEIFFISSVNKSEQN